MSPRIKGILFAIIIIALAFGTGWTMKDYKPAVAKPKAVVAPTLYIHSTISYPEQGKYYIILESKDGTRETWEVSKDECEGAILGVPASEQDRERWKGND
ncbi:MAG: hypothetical protein GXY34_00190 [Syntrophomonadaceae bacterium]|nr:hypothetical protein [Syntrophomonadaceae bacterium]